MEAYASQRSSLARTSSVVDPPDPLDLLHQQLLQEIKTSENPLKRPLRAEPKHSTPANFDSVNAINRKLSSLLPSALAVSAHFIAIGSASGLVAVYTHGGLELKVLRPKRKDFGEVTCLDVSPDEQVLVTGFARGQLALWDLRSGSCLKSSSSLHSYTVVAVCFWKPQHILSSDLTGKLLNVEFAKSRFTSSFKHSLLLKGELGMCLTLKPLLNAQLLNESTDLLAVGSLHAVKLYKHDWNEFFNIQKPGHLEAKASPCMAWRQCAKRRVSFLLGWGLRITLYELRGAAEDLVEAVSYYDMDLEVKGVEWLHADSLVAVSQLRELRVVPLIEFGNQPKVHTASEGDLPRDIVLQYFLKEQADHWTMYNSVKAANLCVFILGKGEFSICRLLDWHETLKVLATKRRWTEVLGYGVEVYHGRAGAFLKDQYDQTKVREALKALVQEFVEFAAVPLETKLAHAVEFCVEVDATDLLLGEIFEFFLYQGNSAEATRVFVETVEPFILSGFIHSMPIVVLSTFINYYASISRADLIDRLVLNLNPHSFEVPFILSVGNELNLVNTLVFVYTQSSYLDFRQPFKLLYNKLAAEKDLRRQKLACYKLLWFIRLCLRGDTFPTGRIPAVTYATAASAVISKLLQKKKLQLLIQVDARVTLDVMHEVFQGPALVSLQPYHQALLERLEAEAKDNYSYQLAMFVIRIAEYASLSKPLCLRAITELMSSQKQAVVRSFAHVTSIDRFIDLVLSSDAAVKEFEYTFEEKSQVILTVVKQLDLTEDELANLTHTVENSPYTAVLIHLHERQRQFHKALLVFLRSEVAAVREQVFDWLGVLQAQMSEDAFKKFRQVVLDCLDILVEINPDKASALMKNWLPGGHLEIIRKLDNAPKLQMKYLAELQPLPQDMTMKYLELLCKFRPAEVYAFLKSPAEYSTEDALQLCFQYQVHDGTAFLLEVLGDPLQAVKVLLSQTTDNPTARLREAYGVCLRNASSLDEADNIELWFPLLVKVLLTSRTAPDLEDLVKQIMEGIVDHVQFDKVLELIDTHFGELEFKHLKDTFIGVLSRYAYQSNILHIAITLLSQDLRKHSDQLYKLRQQGTCVDSFVCDTCYLGSNTQHVCMFGCGHMYHSQCLEEGRCTICVAAAQARRQF